MTSTASFSQICSHAVVVGEYRSGSSNLSTHVTNSGHSWKIGVAIIKLFYVIMCVTALLPSFFHFIFLTSARDRVNSRSMILYNSPSATFYSQNASHLKDDVLRRGPAWQSSCQLHPNHLKKTKTVFNITKHWRLSVLKHRWKAIKAIHDCTHFGTFELPWDTSHDIYSICSTHSNTDAPQAPTVRCVGVCTNQHYSWVGIILQNNLSQRSSMRNVSIETEKWCL